MKLATFGAYIVSARAVPRGDRWEGRFTIRRFMGTWPVALNFVEDTVAKGVFLHEEDAVEGAFQEGRTIALESARDASEQGGPRSSN